MTAVQLIALASTVSLLAGWRLYLVTFAIGLAMKLGYLAMPAQLHSLDVLANSWIIAIAGAGAIAEFCADKVPWVDSAWDAVHTFVRPAGGALLSMAIIDPSDPAWQVGCLLLGGSAALIAHAGKAGARTLINVSPEPYSNIAVSSGEDVITVGLLALAIKFPIAGALVAACVLILAILLVLAARRTLRGIRAKFRPSPRQPASQRSPAIPPTSETD